MSKRAVILCGGKGTRLLPYTVVLPKPLMPVGEFPILEIIVKQLVFYGFDHITMAVNHHAEIIKSFFNSGKKWGVTIDYSLESEPLGTMGPLKLIKDLPENFLVMNGDILTDLDFNEFYLSHINKSEIFSISSCIRSEQLLYGILGVDENNHLATFQEKPVIHHRVSMGVYMVSKKCFDYIPANCEFGFDSLMEKFLKEKIPVNTNDFKGKWLDIGCSEDYEKAVQMFEKTPDAFIRRP